MRVPPRPSSTHTAAAGVQQPALLGEERRDLLEQLPAARRLLPRLVGGGLGQVEREAVHHPPGGVVELDRRGQAAGRQRGLRPHVEGRVDGDRAAGRRHRRGDEIRHALHAIDLHERLAQVELEIAPLVDDLRGQFAFDGRLPIAGGQSGQRRVERQRRQRQRGEEDQQPRRLRAAAQHGPRPVGRRGHRQQHGECRRDRSGGRARRMPDHRAGDGPGDERHQAPAPPARAAPDRPEQRRRGDDHQHGAGRRRVQHHRAHGRRQPAGGQRRQREMVALERRHRQGVRDQHVVVRDRGADAHADQRVQRVAPRRGAGAAAPGPPGEPPAAPRWSTPARPAPPPAASSPGSGSRRAPPAAPSRGSSPRRPRRRSAPRRPAWSPPDTWSACATVPASRRAGRSTSVRPMAAISHSSAATRPHQRARASSISAGATRAVPRIVPSGAASSTAAGSDDAPALGPSSTGASGVCTSTADDRLARAGRGRQGRFGDDHAGAAAGRRRIRQSARAGPGASRAASARGTSPSRRPGATPAASPDGPPTPAARRRRRRW